MLINLHISLITKQFFLSFDSHSDKTVNLSELLLDINNFSNKIVDVIRKSHEVVGSTTANSHEVTDFTTVSGCDQLVVDPTHAHGIGPT